MPDAAPERANGDKGLVNHLAAMLKPAN